MITSTKSAHSYLNQQTGNMSPQDKINMLNKRFYSPSLKQLKIVDYFKRISPKKVTKDKTYKVYSPSLKQLKIADYLKQISPKKIPKEKTDDWLGWAFHEMSGEDGFCWKCQVSYPNNQLCIY